MEATMGITHAKLRGSKDDMQVGDRVSFMFGVKRTTGTVIEDRGHIGVGGRQIVRLVIDIEQDPPMVGELPAEKLEKIG
jgi:hypothetical protein